jgi:hypothetical protein
MMLKKRLMVLTVIGVCLASLCACGKDTSSHQAAEEKSVFIDSIRGEVSDGEGDFYDVLHGSFGDICSSSATKNSFMTRVTSEGSVGYALNSVDFSYEDFYSLEDSLKTLTATELSEFELLAYASYLDRTGNAFDSSLSAASQKVLFNYMQSVYEHTAEDISFRAAVGDAMDAYYADLKVGALSKISYDTNGNYLQIKDNALMTGLYGFGEGETVVSCYETCKGTTSIAYHTEDGGEDSLNVYPRAGIVIGSKGTVIGYEYISFDDSTDYVLRDIYYLMGGGCVNGNIAEENRPLSVTKADLLFFGERSLGSFAEMECYRTFDKLVKDFGVTKTSMSYAIQQDIGISLHSSEGVFMGGLLQQLGFDPDEAEVTLSAVGRAPLQEDAMYGDLYGWYVETMPVVKGNDFCRVEGFAVLHSRDYGFSAENYLRIF